MDEAHHLIIGGDGKVGSAVREAADARDLSYTATTRRFPGHDEVTYYLDLSHPFTYPETVVPSLVKADIVYLIASQPDFYRTEQATDSWIVNVDGTISVADHYLKQGAFIVYISSDAVEWFGHSELARQKGAVESYLRHYSSEAAIIRPNKIIEKEQFERFANFILDVGIQRRPGVHRWRGG